MRIASLIGVAVLATAGIAAHVAGTAVPAAKSSAANLSPILGVEQMPNELRFQVSSNGCTHKDHFEMTAEVQADGTVEVTLHRKEVDMCRRMPMAYEVTMPHEFGDAPIVILNPIVELVSRKG